MFKKFSADKALYRRFFLIAIPIIIQNGITNLVNILRPEILSIGGGISGEGQTLIDALLPIVSKECYGGIAVEQTKICIATLGNDAGIVGAAVLGL